MSLENVETFIKEYKELCERTGISIKPNAFHYPKHGLIIDPYGALIEIGLDRGNIVIVSTSSNKGCRELD